MPAPALRPGFHLFAAPEPRGEHVMRMTLFYLESDEPDAARQVVDEHRLSFFPTVEAAA